VFWRHDGGDNQVCGAVADSYLDWLWDTLQAIKHQDADA
jgi:hypothetical protein